MYIVYNFRMDYMNINDILHKIPLLCTLDITHYPVYSVLSVQKVIIQSTHEESVLSV